MVLENLGLAFDAVFGIKTVLLIFAGTFAGIVAFPGVQLWWTTREHIFTPAFRGWVFEIKERRD